MLVFEGETERPARQLLGNHGLVRVTRTRAVHDVARSGDRFELLDEFEAWIQAGMPHHIVVAEGRHMDRMLRWARHYGEAGMVLV